MSVPSVFCLALLALAVANGPARAQLFSGKGWGVGANSSSSAPLPSRSLRISRPQSTPGGRVLGPLSMFGRWRASGARTYQSHPGDREQWTGNYRTLCVRLCDGYYFPISYRATRGRMHRDAEVCEQTCDCETRLFYLPSSSSDVKHATDLTGQSYGRLENAFEYRRRWDTSCACRSMPWAEPEKIRHEQYAYSAAIAKEEVLSRKGEQLRALLAREDERQAIAEQQAAEAEALRIAKAEEAARRKEEAMALRIARVEEAAQRKAEREQRWRRRRGIPDPVVEPAPAEVAMPASEPDSGPPAAEAVPDMAMAPSAAPAAEHAEPAPVATAPQEAEPIVVAEAEPLADEHHFAAPAAEVPAAPLPEARAEAPTVGAMDAVADEGVQPPVEAAPADPTAVVIPAGDPHAPIAGNMAAVEPTAAAADAGTDPATIADPAHGFEAPVEPSRSAGSARTGPRKAGSGVKKVAPEPGRPPAQAARKPAKSSRTAAAKASRPPSRGLWQL